MIYLRVVSAVGRWDGFGKEEIGWVNGRSKEGFLQLQVVSAVRHLYMVHAPNSGNFQTLVNSYPISSEASIINCPLILY